MSSTIQAAAAPTGQGNSSNVRNKEKSQSDSESFGEALARSLSPAKEPAEKAVDKSTPRPPIRRQTDKPEPGAQDLVNVLGLMLISPENRVAKVATTVAADGKATPSIGASATLLAPLSGLTEDAPASADAAAALPGEGDDRPVQDLLQTRAVKVAGAYPLASDAADSAIPAVTVATGIAANESDLTELANPDRKEQPVRKLAVEADPRLASTATTATVLRTGKSTDSGGKVPAQIIAATGAEGLPEGQKSAAPAVSFDLPSLTHQVTDRAAAPSANVGPPAMAATLTPEVGTGAWGKMLAQEVTLMGTAGHQVTELQLNPPGLGPLKVTLSMHEQQMQASFFSAHSSVRAAVEAALPQLRSMLADSGISLGHTSVGSEGQQQAAFSSGSDNPAQRESSRRAQTIDATPFSTVAKALEPVRPRNGLSIDTYA